MVTTLLLGLGLLWATGAWAQSQTPPTPQFDMTGFIQEATLDTTGAICTPSNDPATNAPSDRLRGGTMTLNGIKMIIPCNTLLQLPAATMTWGDLFDPSVSAPQNDLVNRPSHVTVIGTVPVQGPGQTGLALADNPMPFPSFEVRAQGNVVNGKYIVGLIVPITQQGLNASSGLITYIDYEFGSFRVGGIEVAGLTVCDPTLPGGGPTCPGALVQINDPVGRWGLVHSIDPRFSGDYENTTVHASTGIPVCIPRTDPAGSDDPLCPKGNRPLNGDPRFPTDPFLAVGAPLKIFDMLAPVDGVFPDARQQVPMMVGDQVNYTGTLYKIDPTKTITLADGRLVPDNTASNTYLSAHTVEDVLGIFTAPGVPPAYVTIEDLLIGTNGAAVQGLLQEASTRLTVVGFTTDPTRVVDINAEDVNPCTGQTTLRRLATTDPATQPIRGRFVHRVLGGDFMPPTRNYVMTSRTIQLDANGEPVLVANGIANGHFLLPNFEYIFPENHRLGDPLIPFNFQDLPFLAKGSGPVDGFGTTSPILGQLSPWPGTPTPSPVNCATAGASPIVNAGPDISAGANAQVTLTGAVTWDVNSDPGSRVVQWTQVAGPTVTLTNANSLIASFVTPASPTTLSFTLTATDNIGTGSDTVNVTVLTPNDTVQITAATWVTQNGKRGPFGKLNVTATTSDPTAVLSLTAIGVDGSVTNYGTGTTTANAPTTFDWIELKGAPQPARLTVTSTKGGSALVTCSAQDARGRVTCP